MGRLLPKLHVVCKDAVDVWFKLSESCLLLLLILGVVTIAGELTRDVRSDTLPTVVARVMNNECFLHPHLLRSLGPDRLAILNGPKQIVCLLVAHEWHLLLVLILDHQSSVLSFFSDFLSDHSF